MWRALDSSRLCIQNKPVIPVYSVTLICTTICVQKYTSVYCLLLTNFISYLFRVLP
jgi:hypothetical protein